MPCCPLDNSGQKLDSRSQIAARGGDGGSDVALKSVLGPFLNREGSCVVLHELRCQRDLSLKFLCQLQEDVIGFSGS